MREFCLSELKNKKWDAEIWRYVGAIHEKKGRQSFLMEQKPAKLDKLIEIAKVQSTEASNSIEGIRTTFARLKQLLCEKTTPKNRDEEEIAGYRDVLNMIHENFEYINISPNYILQLHKSLFAHSSKSIGGTFKNVQNYITATDENGKDYVLFTPLAPYETPMAMEELCKSYERALSENEVDPLILIPIFIHDFLCIHPFLDGNGRMSRLLTTLLLYKSGYMIGKYISLESKIANNKDIYYDALEKSGRDWKEGKEDVAPFVKYILGIIISAYRDFDERAQIVCEKVPALEMVKKAISNMIGKFTKAQVMEMCSTLSSSSVESSLKKLCKQNAIIKHGVGKTTFYSKNN